MKVEYIVDGTFYCTEWYQIKDGYLLSKGIYCTKVIKYIGLDFEIRSYEC